MFQNLKNLLFLPGIFFLMTLAGFSALAGEEDRIQPYEKNPSYWQYKGEPVMLLGGSKDDNLFQIPDLKEHLDLMQEVGANYIRNTMSGRDEGNVQAFLLLSEGKYDLERWNEEYWQRFKNMLDWTAEREIFVQIELWDQWDHIDGRWDGDPWNPDQNMNYTTSDTRLKGNGNYGNITYNNGIKHDLFLTIPEFNNDGKVLAYQQKFIDQVLAYTFQYDHVLYTVTNELFFQHPKEWSLYWIQYVKAKAEEAGVPILITEMFQGQDITHEQHRVSLDHPEIFDYVELSQNSTERDDTHWDRLQWARDYISEKIRPINHTKTYGGPGAVWTHGEDHGVERFWRNIVGGAASCRFHRPTSGLGLNDRAQAHLRSARMLLDEHDIFNSKVDVKHSLLSDRDADEAYLTYIAGKQYALYFPQGGSVQLDLSDAAGNFTMRWLNAEKSEWGQKNKISGGGKVVIQVPEKGLNWIAFLSQED